MIGILVIAAVVVGAVAGAWIAAFVVYMMVMHAIARGLHW